MKTFLQSHWKVVLVINFALGAFLWFLDSTDFSLRGTISDIAFPPLVFILAVITIVAVPDAKKRRISRLVCLPSLIAGGFHFLVGLIMIIPPFTLALLFSIDEIKSEVQIQQISSPDTKQIAEVYFRPVGAYSGGNGRIYVKVTNRSFTLIERDILYLRVSHADENTKNYLKWSDNNTLYISEIDESISIGNIEFETPYAIAVPINFVRLLSTKVQFTKQDYYDKSQIYQPPLPRRPRKESPRLRWRDGYQPASPKSHCRTFRR